MDDPANAHDVVRDCARILSLCRRGGNGRDGRITPRQAAILQHLDPDAGCGVAELAERLGVTLSTMSLSLDRLARRGCIRRQRDPADGRRVRVTLTERGRRLRESGAVLDGPRLLNLLGALTPGERRAAAGGIALLAGVLDRDRPEPVAPGHRAAAVPANDPPEPAAVAAEDDDVFVPRPAPRFSPEED